MGAVIQAQAVGQLRAEFLPQRLIFLPLIGKQLFQLTLDAALQCALNQLELAVMLQHLTADVEGKILAVHQTPHKAEIIGQQVGALFHDKNAAGIKLQALFVAGGVVIHCGMCRNKQQGVKGGAALGAGVDHQRRILVIIELSLVEVVVFLRCDLALLLAPQRDHAVEGGLLPNGLIFGLFGGFLALRHRLGAVLRHRKGDGVADIVGIFLHQLGKAVFLQKFAVFLVLGVVLQVQRYPRAGNSHFARLDGVALGAAGFPATAGCFAPCAAFHRYMVSQISSIAEEGIKYGISSTFRKAVLFSFRLFSMAAIRKESSQMVGAHSTDNSSVFFKPIWNMGFCHTRR